jgi:hypothetical protein
MTDERCSIEKFIQADFAFHHPNRHSFNAVFQKSVDFRMYTLSVSDYTAT